MNDDSPTPDPVRVIALVVGFLLAAWVIAWIAEGIGF